MATAEQVLALWQTLAPREREAVFLAIAQEAAFSPTVRELASASLRTTRYQSLQVGDRFRFAGTTQECLRVKGGYIPNVAGSPPRLTAVQTHHDGLSPVVYLG